MKEYIIKIKDIEIPYCIKNYKKSKSIKIYFKEDKLTITKSPYVSKKDAEKLIYKNEEKIYEAYKKILESNRNKKSSWSNGQTILYKGEKFIIDVIYKNQNNIDVSIQENDRIIRITIPDGYKYKKNNDKDNNNEQLYIKKAIIQAYNTITCQIINERLPYWSKKMKIEYNNVKVRDAKTRYGSCVPKTKTLHFTSRLIMLKEDAIDAVIVHELCHIIHPNHSKQFYELVENYIPNYKQQDKYLKECSKYIRM